MSDQPKERQKEAQQLQHSIDHEEWIQGRSYLALGFLYREMRNKKLWAALGFASWTDWMDRGSDVGRSRIEDSIFCVTQLEGSYSSAQIKRMKYDNARLLVTAFNDNVPKKLRAKLMKDAAGLRALEFHETLDRAKPNLHIEVKHPKTFVLSKPQHGKLKHAINKIKRDQGATTEAEAVEIMADNSITANLKELPINTVTALARKIQAVEEDRDLMGRDAPTKEQWAEIVRLTDVMASTLLDVANAQAKAEVEA